MAATLPSVISRQRHRAHPRERLSSWRLLIALFAAPPSLAVIALPNDTDRGLRALLCISGRGRRNDRRRWCPAAGRHDCSAWPRCQRRLAGAGIATIDHIIAAGDGCGAGRHLESDQISNVIGFRLWTMVAAKSKACSDRHCPLFLVTRCVGDQSKSGRRLMGCPCKSPPIALPGSASDAGLKRRRRAV